MSKHMRLLPPWMSRACNVPGRGGLLSHAQVALLTLLSGVLHGNVYTVPFRPVSYVGTVFAHRQN